MVLQHKLDIQYSISTYISSIKEQPSNTFTWNIICFRKDNPAGTQFLWSPSDTQSFSGSCPIYLELSVYLIIISNTYFFGTISLVDLVETLKANLCHMTILTCRSVCMSTGMACQFYFLTSSYIAWLESSNHACWGQCLTLHPIGIPLANLCEN